MDTINSNHENYILLFNNQDGNFKFREHSVEKETKNFVWLKSEQSDNIKKVSKRTKRVWIIKGKYAFETAKCNILEKVSDFNRLYKS